MNTNEKHDYGIPKKPSLAFVIEELQVRVEAYAVMANTIQSKIRRIQYPNFGPTEQLNNPPVIECKEPNCFIDEIGLILARLDGSAQIIVDSITELEDIVG